uniref:ACB domain-containing protein n=1 Tax=Monopterus albus TaxID=43700 RepID=A0A3Q3Q8J6_MONAL
MAQDGDKHGLEEKFAAAVKVMQSLPEEGPFQPSDNMKLMFYSYYKQATSGPCNISRPSGFWDTCGKAKWDAWRSLGNMTKEDAMKNYIENIQLILEAIPISDEVSDLVQKLGDFYTEVDGGGEEAEVDGGGEEAEENEADRRPFTRPFASHADWSPDPRLLKVEDKWWTSGTRGSSSSMELSMSSFTNGTHSSLNSEVEEEELACSIEPTVQCNLHMHFNGHLSDHSDAAQEKNHRSTDSDNEEFCDSMEHLAMEEPVSTSGVQSCESGTASLKQKDLRFVSSTAMNGGEDQVGEGISTSQSNSSLSRRGRGLPSPRASCRSQLCSRGDASHSYESKKRHPVTACRGNLNEQIATALLKLQCDMANVLHRLHTLEALTVSQSRSSSPRQEDSLSTARKFLRPSWWPFDFAPLTVVLTALWPLIAHLLVQLYLQRKRKKIP